MVTTTATDATEAASGNITLAELGKRMATGRSKKAATSSAPAKAAGDGAKTATSAASSEQADADEAKTALSTSESEDSNALAAEATAAEAEVEPAETAADTEGTEAAEASEDGEQADKGVRDLQKRVGKLTAQRNEAREALAELKAEVDQLKEQLHQAKPQAQEAHPGDRSFGRDRTVQEIDMTLQGVEGFLQWADQNPDGGTYAEGEKSYQLSDEDVRSYRRRCENDRIRLNARKEARLETLRLDFDARRAAAHDEAVKLYPWVTQKGSPEFQDAMQVIQRNPAVLEQPDFELIIARQVTGQRLEREAVKKLAKPAAKTAPRAVTPVVTHSPSTTQAKGANAAATVSALEKQIHEAGKVSVHDLSKLLAQRRQARLEAAKA